MKSISTGRKAKLKQVLINRKKFLEKKIESVVLVGELPRTYLQKEHEAIEYAIGLMIADSKRGSKNEIN